MVSVSSYIFSSTIFSASGFVIMRNDIQVDWLWNIHDGRTAGENDRICRDSQFDQFGCLSRDLERSNMEGRKPWNKLEESKIKI